VGAEELRRAGVALLGFEPYTRSPSGREALLKSLPPRGLAGLDVLVRITFAAGMDGLDPSCGDVVAREETARLEEAVGREGGEFLIRAPGEWQKSGYMVIVLTFPETLDRPRMPGGDGRPWDWDGELPCVYSIDAVEVLPDGDAVPERGEGAAPQGTDPPDRERIRRTGNGRGAGVQGVRARAGVAAAPGGPAARAVDCGS
jgi:hypothetical protein